MADIYTYAFVSGGTEVSGVSDVAKLLEFVVSGGVKPSGAPNTLYARTYPVLGAGGVKFSGYGTFITLKILVPTGRLKVGTFAVTEWEKLYQFTVSGGIKLSGIATTRWEKLYIALVEGGIFYSGTITVFYKKKYVASGGLKSSSTWEGVKIFNRVGFGGVKCSGSSTRSKNRSWIGKGKIII